MEFANDEFVRGKPELSVKIGERSALGGKVQTTL